MAYQTLQNMVLAYEVQSALGTPSSGAGAKALRHVTVSFNVERALIVSNVSRSDGQSNRPRLGSRKVVGTIECELSVGELDELFRALFRASAETAEATRTYNNGAGLTSLTVDSTSQITQVGTTTLLGVLDRGDLFQLDNMSTAANNDTWFVAKTVTATIITVYGTPLTAQGADNACDMTIAKKLTQGDPPTERYFTFEIYNQDIDLSERFTDVKVCSVNIRKSPNAPVSVVFGFMGLDGDPQAVGASPVFTTPTEYTGKSLVPSDGMIAVGGTVYTDLTAFEISLDLLGQVPDVLAPNSPDVFLANAVGRGSFSTLITDLDHLTAFDAETAQEIVFHMVEPESNPKDGMAFYIGDAILTSHPSPGGGVGPKVVPVSFAFGKDEGGSDRAATMMKIASTAAAL